MRRRSGELPGECAISGCKDWAHVRGLCAACYSAWFRLRSKTAGQAKEYLYRIRRLESRVPVLVGAQKDDDPHFERERKPRAVTRERVGAQVRTQVRNY